MRRIIGTKGRVVIYPASGTGAWEAALVNTLSPGDRVLMYETGHLATLWKGLAERLGLKPEFIAGDWRSGADPAAIGGHLAGDKSHAIKADRKSVVEGKSVTVRVDIGGRRIIKKNTRKQQSNHIYIYNNET